MKQTKLLPVSLALMLASFVFTLSAAAQTNILITELMASNTRTLADEDGDFEDWVEIYNAGTNTVNLDGWYLQDGSRTWRFPDTNLAPNAFLIAFASNKDRRIPGRQLHTNFRLEKNGENLALLYPDGVTVASSYSPNYPIQAPDISYGLPVVQTVVALVSNGAPAKLLVPANGTLNTTWTVPDFDDAAWTSVNNGIGFEADGAVVSAPVLLADSVAEFSGTHGVNNWFYGYWNKTADADGIYSAMTDYTPFPRGTGNTLSSTNYWDGSKWDYPAGNPPWTELTGTGGHPSGDNGVPSATNHWVIRRWVAETNGPLRITGTLSCSSTGGTCGDGTVGRIFIDGTEVFQRAVFGTSIGYSIVVNANPGSLVDVVIDPGTGNNDFCDATTFTATIYSTGGAAVVADTIADWSNSGAQAEKNWSYGYFDRTTGGTYAANKFSLFPNGTGPHSAGNYWNGEVWQWFDGAPPFDTIGQIETRPSIFGTGGLNSNEHWVLRRWVSEVSGTIHVDWHVAKKDLTGGGVTATVFQNGTQRDALVLAGNDFVGANRTITITGVQVGDFIDFAVAPGADIIGDFCFFNATIHGSGTLAGQFVSDVGNSMTNTNATAYLRIPFTLSDLSAISGLTLRMKYDDGFAACLNGALVASASAPESPAWNSSATSARPDADASQFRDFSLDNLRDFLVLGANVLAIQGLNASPTDADFLIVAELLASRTVIDASGKRYFASPTPGSINGLGTTNLGPLIADTVHTPADPLDAQDLLVTARVSPTLYAVTNVTLLYRIMYGAEVAVPMFDDGLHGDGLPADGLYGAAIPNAAYTNGQMIRYYVTSRDNRSNLTRQPPLGDTNNSTLYFGTICKDPSLTNSMAVLHWFTQSTINSTTFQRASFYWRGEFYDNVKMNVHGQSSQGFRNHSFNVDFNPDHHFEWAEGENRADDINLLSTFADKSHMRLLLSYQIYADSGPRAPYHFCVPVRMQSNGVFHSIMHVTENGDDKYLKRLGRDPNGAMYKMYTQPTDPAMAEKKTRRWEDKADFNTFVAGINSATNRVYLYDNLDVSEAANFFAAMIVTASVDCCHKNFYLYRDSDGDGEWEMLPWDLDLSFGRNWQSTENYWDDRVYPNNGLNIGGSFPLGPNTFFNTAADKASFRAMYLRRVRTLQDELLQTNGTPAAQLNFERQIDYWTGLMAADGALDLAKWGSWGQGNGGDGGPAGGTRIDNPTVICRATAPVQPSVPCWRTLSDAAAELKTNYLFNRRAFVFTQKMNNPTEFPDAQPTNVNILVGSLDYNPASGNQAQEYVQLINTNSFSVDISGWRLSGAIDHTFQGGVVIPRFGLSNTLYVVADKKAFRSRATAPKGGMGFYMEGPYQGQLSARGESIILTDKLGRSRTNTYVGNPTPAQSNLRITEIMYHPGRSVGALMGSEEEYEYVELKNIGSTNLNLTGVHFVTGIEFTFTGSAVTNLAGGQSVLIVRNMAAFAARYGGGFNIAGQFVGSLENAGENLRLDDAVGEKVLDFNYDNTWYPITDGAGPSLVVVDESASWTNWNQKANWRPSGYDTGSPGTNDPPLGSVAAILVNEILTHSDLGLVDTIELYNPNTNEVSVLGWYLTDDFVIAKKFWITNNVVIPAGGYVTFDENDFNVPPGSPVRFSFSSRGDEAYVFSGDTNGNLSGYFHGYQYGAAETNVSFGRYRTSTGAVHFVAQSERTFGATNALPKVGPLVIGEIMYHPPDLAGGVDNQDDEYIEVLNISDADVALFDPSYATNTWHLRGAVDFDFPTNQTLGSNGILLVLSFDPTNVVKLAAFRARYGVSNSVPVFGPYSGKLDNSHDTVTLSKPAASYTNGVPYILVDEVEYSGASPWPVAADGWGASLQRVDASTYGNDLINWIAATPGAGRSSAGGTAPVITSPPANASVLGGTTVTLTVSATGSGPLNYQWRFNGTNLAGATNSLLLLPNVQLTQAGSYAVSVFGPGGSATSSNAVLSVLAPIKITAQPQAIAVRPGTNAATFTNVTFTVGVMSGFAQVSYQWSFNGVQLPNATNAALTITNVQLPNDGLYSVGCSDAISSVTSASARLTVLINPTIVQQPLSQTVVTNGTVVLSIGVTNTATLPVWYRWRRGGTTVTNYSLNAYNSFFTVTNVNAGVSAATANTNWTVIVTNSANASSAFLSSNALLTILIDTDGDGLPDAWMTQYFGHADGQIGDLSRPGDDADGDGFTNAQEQIAGTHPRDNTSYLKVEQITSGVNLQFNAISNRTYTVQFKTNLNDVVWLKLLELAARNTNWTVQATDPVPGDNQRVYRLVVPAQ